MISVDERHGGADLTGSWGARGAGSKGQDTLLGLKSWLHQSSPQVGKVVTFTTWKQGRKIGRETEKKIQRQKEIGRERDRPRKGGPEGRQGRLR